MTNGGRSSRDRFEKLMVPLAPFSPTRPERRGSRSKVLCATQRGQEPLTRKTPPQIDKGESIADSGLAIAPAQFLDPVQQIETQRGSLVNFRAKNR